MQYNIWNFSCIYTYFSRKMYHELSFSRAEYLKQGESISYKKIDKYKICQKVGGGSSGCVFRALNQQTRTQVAFKVYDIGRIEQSKESEMVKSIKKRLLNSEAELMMKLDCDHIIKCYDIYENKELKIIVTDYFSGGTLTSKIQSQKHLQEEVALDYMRQILIGVSEMHRRGIIHRDLKSDNIMFHNGVIKIIDLGFSKLIQDKLTQTPLGTLTFMAPEIFQKKKYGYKADIWSLGILFYLMIYGIVPFFPKNIHEFEKNIFPNHGKVKGIKPSDQMVDFIKGLLVFDPNKRMGWEQIKNHPVFQTKLNYLLPESFRIRRNINDIPEINNFEPITDQELMSKVQETRTTQSTAVKLQDLPISESKNIQNLISHEDLEWGQKKYLQCLKAEFILRNIIQPIEQKELLSLEKKVNIELLYLLSSTCFKYLSFAQCNIKQVREEFKKFVEETMIWLYKEVKEKFQKYSKRMQKAENKFGEIIKDKFSSIFYSKQQQQKETMMNGIENIDYQKSQFITYTYNKYIKQMIRSIDAKQNGKLHICLEKYREINGVTMKDLKQKTFKTWINELTSDFMQG